MQMLHGIRQKAHDNGVTDLRWLTDADVSALEPSVRCTAALLSPSTGVCACIAWESSVRRHSGWERVMFLVLVSSCGRPAPLGFVVGDGPHTTEESFLLGAIATASVC